MNGPGRDLEMVGHGIGEGACISQFATSNWAVRSLTRSSKSWFSCRTSSSAALRAVISTFIERVKRAPSTSTKG